ncbi:MAG: FAD-binding protein [Firmicutes bacterium]|nr:FAD-binding protein [Bacillota bacterium]
MINVRQIKIPVLKDSDIEIKNKLSHKLKINENDILSFEIKKRSIDARNKDEILYCYELDVSVKNEEKVLKRTKSNDILPATGDEYTFKITGQQKMKYHPIVVGSGPAGLFAAYLLAENGYKPIVLERGEKIEDRIKTVESFWETGNLNPNSNVQFGEGGAGTFSDGKLNTLVKNTKNRNYKVFETFVECGAPKEIMYDNKPHIGTDILRNVVINLRNKIIKLGGEFHYNSTLTNLRIENNELVEIEINNKEKIPCENLILAIGHSARDTFAMLYKNQIKMTPKSFAVGVRIQHSQDKINESQYGDNFKNILPPASYKLTYTTKKNRGVYSFCMCPGGYVVNASSEENRLAINGMSNYQRETENANSAIVVTVTPDDFGNNPLDGLEYQRKLEEKAYTLGNGNIPIQLWKDYKNNQISTEFLSINPVFKGKYTFADLNELFSDDINEALKEGIESFKYKIKDYALDDAILAGVESRTSSPVRIERDEFGNSNIKGIFPCGEGAGYAGGITTAAMDGIKVAEMIASIYSNESID